MKLSSWNVNGIRACIRKGFWDWFDSNKADIVCLQETKIRIKDFEKIALEHDLTSLVGESSESSLFDEVQLKKRRKPVYYAIVEAEKAGYSGVCVLTKIKPHKIEYGLGIEEFDREGRTLILHFDDFILVNTYVPNGGRDLSRVPYKIEYSDALLAKLQKLRKKQKNIIICGDMNVAHTEIDIKNAKSNVKNSGFTPIERDWFTKLLNQKYLDSYRHLNPDKIDVYTWWSFRPGVREKNIGWRIDYFVVTEEMAPLLQKASVQMRQMGSDHCPIHLEIPS